MWNFCRVKRELIIPENIRKVWLQLEFTYIRQYYKNIYRQKIT